MKYIAFVSYGKDSLAQLIEIKRLGLPLDEAVYVDIRYVQDVSGEHPLMAEWIPTAERILLDKFGIKVKHITSQYTFKEQFYTIKKKGKHIGERYGFPFIIGAWCNSRLKMSVINQYIRSLNDDVTEYVGIAYDEPKRYERLVKKATDHIQYQSVLVDQKITEAQAFDICRPHNLISPIYEFSQRGGCWFCVKQSQSDLYELWKTQPGLFDELKSLEKESRCTFKPGFKLCDLEKRFEDGYVPKRIIRRKP